MHQVEEQEDFWECRISYYWGKCFILILFNFMHSSSQVYHILEHWSDGLQQMVNSLSMAVDKILHVSVTYYLFLKERPFSCYLWAIQFASVCSIQQYFVFLWVINVCYGLLFYHFKLVVCKASSPSVWSNYSSLNKTLTFLTQIYIYKIYKLKDCLKVMPVHCNVECKIICDVSCILSAHICSTVRVVNCSHLHVHCGTSGCL